MRFLKIKFPHFKKKMAIPIIAVPLGCLFLGFLVCLFVFGKTTLLVIGGWFFGLMQVVIVMGICVGMFFLSRWQTGWRWVAIPAVIGALVVGVNFGRDFLIRPWIRSSLPSAPLAKPEKKEAIHETQPEKEMAVKKPKPPSKKETGPIFTKIRPGEVIDLSKE